MERDKDESVSPRPVFSEFESRFRKQGAYFFREKPFLFRAYLKPYINRELRKYRMGGMYFSEKPFDVGASEFRACEGGCRFVIFHISRARLVDFFGKIRKIGKYVYVFGVVKCPSGKRLE